MSSDRKLPPGFSRRRFLSVLPISATPLLACPRPDAEPSPSADNTGSDATTTTMDRSTSSPADSLPFQLDVRSTSGNRLAHAAGDAGTQVDVHEYTMWLRIRSDVSGFVAPPKPPSDEERTGFVPPAFEDDGLAVMVVTREWHERGRDTIGLYHCRLEARELDQLRRAVEGTPWAELPRPIGGDYHSPQFVIRYSSGSLLIERYFNARSSNFTDAIEPLWKLIGDRIVMLSNRPGGNLEVNVSAEQTRGDPTKWTFRLALENRGTGAIVLTDPRIPFGDGTPRLDWRVGERVVDRDNFPPLEWITIPLPPLSDDAPRSLVVNAKSRFELTTTWVAPKAGNYALRGTWRDYQGPIEPVSGQLPFMPLPEIGPSTLGSGPYPIRGSVFAEDRFTVPEKKAGKP
jgi:hypothetical protein